MLWSFINIWGLPELSLASATGIYHHTWWRDCYVPWNGEGWI